jgi:hypothetical protein
MRGFVVLAQVVGDVSVDPTTSGLPGAKFLQTVLDWAAQLALWGSLGALLAGAAIYGMSHQTGHLSGASRGKTLAVAGLIGAALTGVAPTAVNLLFQAARG